MVGPFEKNRDTTHTYSLSIDFSPYMDFLEESDVSPRETVEAVDSFEHIFSEIGFFDTHFRHTWDHVSDGRYGWVDIDQIYFDALSERGDLNFKMEYALTEAKEEHLREAIGNSLDRSIDNCSTDIYDNPGENPDIRSHGYEFDADYAWNDDALVITGPDN